MRQLQNTSPQRNDMEWQKRVMMMGRWSSLQFLAISPANYAHAFITERFIKNIQPSHGRYLADTFQSAAFRPYNIIHNAVIDQGQIWRPPYPRSSVGAFVW